MTLQEKLDSIDYPPTHQYTIDTLEPKGFLKKRMRFIPVSFFQGDRFLDIGCNKGYFSLLAMKNCKYVESFDNDSKYVELCKELGINATLNTFRNYNPDKKFDRIMLGNVMHYMYRECGDWSFIIKLAAISTGLVLIEAPTGMNCKLMKIAIPKHLRKNFNDESFRKIMDKFFVLKSISNSPSQGRYIMVFERKKPNHIAFDEYGHNMIKQGKESTVYVSKDNVIKIQNNPTIKDEIRIFISSHSPISNGLESFVYNYGKFCGWVERYSVQKKLKPYSRQKEVLEKLCNHNVYLAKLGYTEIDMGVSNFWPDLTLFDKGGVVHIDDLSPLGINDIKKGWYFTMFRNQFDIEIDYELIHKALNSRDSKKIEVVFADMIIPDKKNQLKSLLFELGCMGVGIGVMGLVTLGMMWWNDIL